MALVATCITLGSLSSGVTSVAIMTAGMQFASRYTQAGTDMTAVQSTRDIGELASSMMLVGLTAAVGYSGGFMLGAGIAFVALLVTFSHYRYMKKSKLNCHLPAHSLGRNCYLKAISKIN